MEKIFTYLLVAFIGCHFPIIRTIFCTVNILVHETGHAIALAKHTGVPTMFWGLLFFVQSIISVYYVFKLFIF